MHDILRHNDTDRDVPRYEVSGDDLDCPVPSPSVGDISDVPPTDQ